MEQTLGNSHRGEVECRSGFHPDLLIRNGTIHSWTIKDMPCGFAIISYFPHRFGGVPWKGNLRKQQAVSSLLDVISRVYFGDIKTGTISDDIPLARRKFKEASIPG
ncbi:hypothetical protein RvY_08184-1 [Ramazzottius varieornatus]|uniref:Uncharacterized protein n=1 Tax=Ramazzottius varieornatus TaxID=947166 RepID=A0A1D1V4W0_RAMVA|nr:hypothetical protein RvY_08184-1 [Ramazzottius varieornatus]